MTLRVERGDLLMLADGRGRLDSARPYVDADSILPECQPVVVQDDLVLRFEDSASVEHPEDPLSRRTGWWLDGGSVVIEVVNQPDCLDERFHAVVIDSSYTEDGIEEPAATLVVTIDSPVWGVLNRAVLVK
jgi:hypothetical protein